MLLESLKEDYNRILFYDETSLEGRLVKAADRICAYIKCVEESKAGNGEFQKAQQSIMKKIKSMDLPEVDYFMKHFMDNFSLTLDELN